MRSSSSWRSVVAVSLCAVLTGQWAVPAVSKATEPPEPALLLKYAAPDISEAESRQILDPLPGVFAGVVRVRWVAVPLEEVAGAEETAGYPLPDDAALRDISSKVARASAHMEKVEKEEARVLLAEAEEEARGFRFTETVRPFLAEVSLQQGILKLWEGDTAGAEALLSRFRALRPDFSPDPALFSPQFLAAWANVRKRPLPEAELLVQSVPSGATITLDGVFAGTTPLRVHPETNGPVTVRASHPGYRDVERTGQWLPGDAETIRWTLPGDREARLGELLARPEGREGSGAGPIIAEFGRAAGVRRVAVLTLRKSGTGEGYRVGVYSGAAAGEDPVFLGATEVPGGTKGGELFGTWASQKLVQGGWPEEQKDPEGKAWYKTWWIWGILIAGVGLAAALGGGGGGSTGGGGSVSVDF